MKKGEVLHGFRLVRRRDVENVGKTKKKLHVFEHEESGLTVFWLAGEEEKKTCVIGVRTHVKDDSGIAHVVEHAVMSGSERYPVKNLAYELIHLDKDGDAIAWTTTNLTVYQFASSSEKRFFRLLDIFLDGIYHPQFYNEPRIFEREGWHYEWKDGALCRNGVVYSEMKDVVPLRSVVWRRATAKALYPGAQDCFESGGVPEKIAQLTQERIVAFHQAFYHPANTCITLAGDIEIARVLRYLDEDVLPRAPRHPRTPYEPHHPHVSPLRRVVQSYPHDPNAGGPGEVVTTLTWMIDQPPVWLEPRAKGMLSYCLFEDRDSPIHQALKDKRYKASLLLPWEAVGRQQTMTLVLRRRTQKDAAPFEETVRKALQDIDPEELYDALLRFAEDITEEELQEDDETFQKMEIQDICASMLFAWQQGKHPLRLLRTGAKRDFLQRLRDGSVFRFVWENIIKTPPSLLLTLVPSDTWQENGKAQERRALASAAAHMTAEEKAHIRARQKALQAWQAEPDPPDAIDAIAAYALDEVPVRFQAFPLDETDFCDAKLFVGASEEPDAFHMRMEFDVSALTREERTALPVFVRSLNRMARRSSDSFLRKTVKSFHAWSFTTRGRTGEARSIISLEFDGGMIAGEHAMLWLHHFLEHGAERMARISDLRVVVEERWKEKQKRGFEEHARFGFTIVQPGYQVIPYLAVAKADIDAMDQALEEWHAAFDEAYPVIKARLQQIWTAMRHRARIAMLLCVPPGADWGNMRQGLRFVISSLSEGAPAPLKPTPMPEPKRVGFCAASPLQYIAAGWNFHRSGFSYIGSMKVLENLLTSQYLMPRIRGAGGAYGAQCFFHPRGEMQLYAWNDPHLLRTLDVFRGAADFVRTLDLTEQELQQTIHGVLCNEDVQRQTADDAFTDWRRGITPAMHQQFLDEVRGTTLDDLRALAPIFDACADHGALCVYGNRDVLEAHRELFDTLEDAPF